MINEIVEPIRANIFETNDVILYILNEPENSLKYNMTHISKFLL